MAANRIQNHPVQSGRFTCLLTLGETTMNDAPAKPAEQPANLTALHHELVDLAIHSRPADRPREEHQRVQGAVLVIRGK